MQTIDITLVGTVFPMVITAYSGAPLANAPQVSVYFNVTIDYYAYCSSLTLSAPIINNPLQIYYWQPYSYSFNGMLADSTCGPLIFTLLYSSNMT